MNRIGESFTRVLATFMAAVLVVMVLASCKSSTTTTTTTSTTTTAAAPTVTITQPSGMQFAPGNVKVSVQVANFRIVNKLGQANVAGEGHVHYFIDVDAPTTPGKPAVTAPGTYAASTDTSYTWPGVGVGTHKLSVELMNNDHTPLDPPVVATVTVTVTGTGAVPTSTPTT